MVESPFIAYIDDHSMTQQTMRRTKPSTQSLVIERTVKKDENLIEGILRLASKSPEAYSSVLDMVEATPQGQDLSIVNLIRVARTDPKSGKKILPVILKLLTAC